MKSNQLKLSHVQQCKALLSVSLFCLWICNVSSSFAQGFGFVTPVNQHTYCASSVGVEVGDCDYWEAYYVFMNVNGGDPIWLDYSYQDSYGCTHWTGTAPLSSGVNVLYADSTADDGPSEIKVISNGGTGPSFAESLGGQILSSPGYSGFGINMQFCCLDHSDNNYTWGESVSSGIGNSDDEAVSVSGSCGSPTTIDKAVQLWTHDTDTFNDNVTQTVTLYYNGSSVGGPWTVTRNFHAVPHYTNWPVDMDGLIVTLSGNSVSPSSGVVLTGH